MKLTHSQTRYLIAIYRLSNDKEGVRSSGIAKALGVTRPSVSRMLLNLTKLGLLDKRLYGTVYLTESGKALARERYQELTRLGNQLETGLAIPSDVAEKCALLLISELPQNI
ncbi:MAG: metal-dependent transcriptional regulator [Acetanaerobacterium sp.]